jgi:hypothetical protein
LGFDDLKAGMDVENAFPGGVGKSESRIRCKENSGSPKIR